MLQRARKQPLVLKRLLRYWHSGTEWFKRTEGEQSHGQRVWLHNIISVGGQKTALSVEKILSVNLQINIYIWPQEGTITQHYQSQQSSYIKADLPTLIYSLISELMSLFRDSGTSLYSAQNVPLIESNRASETRVEWVYLCRTCCICLFCHFLHAY